MALNKKYSITGFSILVVLAATLAATSLIRRHENVSGKTLSDQKARKQYVCSMHPQVIRDAPGDCPICGMFLIEKMTKDENSFDTSLTDIVRSVNESVLASVMTVTPEKSTLPLVIDASGIINYDPRKIQTVSARFGGIIEKSFVKYEFQYIHKDQKIFEIFSPYIYNDKWNYVKFVQGYPDNDEYTVEARQWLVSLGLTKGQIDSLKRSVKPDYHLTVYSSGEGYAVSREFDPERFFSRESGEEDFSKSSLAGSLSLGLNDGVTVVTGEPLFKLIDVRSLRVDLKVKTDEAPLLRNGQKVIIADAANPSKQFKGEISQIEPLNGGLFQTVKVYITDNERFLLPGRQIEARITIGPHAGLWLPVSAVVNMGQQRSVFRLEGNKFVATEVTTGVRSENRIEVLSGIDPDAEIAVKALLLIDSDGFIVAN